MGDPLGDFLRAYDEYLNGTRAYEDLPKFGDAPPRICDAYCQICDRKFTRKPKPEPYVADGYVAGRVGCWSFPVLCPTCVEISQSGPRQPLPVARVVKRTSVARRHRNR